MEFKLKLQFKHQSKSSQELPANEMAELGIRFGPSILVSESGKACGELFSRLINPLAKADFLAEFPQIGTNSCQFFLLPQKTQRFEGLSRWCLFSLQFSCQSIFLALSSVWLFNV
jgi:hypothetical protein